MPVICDVSVAGRGKERAAEADRQQDGVCAARLRAGPWSGLREHPSRVSRGQAAQGLHVQLSSQVHVDRHTTSIGQRRVPAVHERSVGDRSEEVRSLRLCVHCLLLFELLSEMVQVALLRRTLASSP